MLTVHKYQSLEKRAARGPGTFLSPDEDVSEMNGERHEHKTAAAKKSSTVVISDMAISITSIVGLNLAALKKTRA